jgi:hypothetical protein
MTNQTTEILLILSEECAEVIQAISKCQRFGITGRKEGEVLSNAERLEEEIGDLLAMVELLQSTDEFKNSWGNIQLAKKTKFEKLKKWSTIVISN